MMFQKPPLTLQQQLQKWQDRGLTIADPAKTLHYLRFIGYPYYLQAESQRPAWLRVDRLLGEQGIPKDSPAGREMFARQMERRWAEEATADYEKTLAMRLTALLGALAAECRPYTQNTMRGAFKQFVLPKA